MSTQDQNTPQQKDARPIWARRCAKATAEAVQPQHYTRADMLKQSNIWFRKQGVPLIIPARQRALEAFPRSVPWILWAGIMHICYIFLRDILLLVVEDVKGSLPNYIKALTSDSASVTKYSQCSYSVGFSSSCRSSPVCSLLLPTC